MAHRVSVRNQQTKSQDRVVPGGTDVRAERQAQEEKNWERQPFYLLTSALMGDPNGLLVPCRSVGFSFTGRGRDQRRFRPSPFACSRRISSARSAMTRSKMAGAAE